MKKAVTRAVAALLGGGLAGSLLGLFEAHYVVASGADDPLAYLYAWVLYGLIGAGLAVPAAALTEPVAHLGARRDLTDDEGAGSWAAAAGALSALLPLGLVLGRYLLNRDVYAEAGVPLSALGLLAAVLLVGWAIGWLALRIPLIRPLTVPLHGAGWLVGLLITGGVSAPAFSPAELHVQPAAEAGLPEPADGPDALFLMVDTLRADHVSPELTPNLWRLTRGGTRYERAYAAASWTRSSGASMWTSRLPSGHGADTKGARLGEAAVLWSEALQASGIRTGALVNNINMTASFGFDQGFDHFEYLAPAYPLGATESVFGLSMYKLLARVAERVAPAERVSAYYQPADVVIDRGLSMIDALEAQGRWAVFLHFMEPHDPYFDHDTGQHVSRAADPDPDPSRADELAALYRGEVIHLDRQLGRLFDALDASGRWDDTLIVLTADHGEEFQEHGGWWHGDTLYEEQIHVPLLVKWPAAQTATRGTGSDPRPVTLLDLPPLIAGVLGVPADPSWRGRVPGPLPVPPQEVPNPCAPRLQPTTRPILAEEDFNGNVLSAVIHGNIKWIRANESNPRGLPTSELFDLADDPDEQANLVGSGRSVCGRYAEDWVRGHADTLDTVLKGSASGAVEGGQVERTAAETRRLCALGYLSGPDCE